PRRRIHFSGFQSARRAGAARAGRLHAARSVAGGDHQPGKVSRWTGFVREGGNIASLVLLDPDPLSDMRNTRRISTVVVNGRYLPKESLQKLLADAEAA